MQLSGVRKKQYFQTEAGNIYQKISKEVRNGRCSIKPICSHNPRGMALPTKMSATRDVTVISAQDAREHKGHPGYSGR